MGMNMFMNSLYNGQMQQRNKQNANPFGIDQRSHLASHFMQTGSVKHDINSQRRPMQQEYQLNDGQAQPRMNQTESDSTYELRNEKANILKDNNNQKDTVSASISVKREETTVFKDFGVNDLKNAILINEIISAPISKRKHKSSFGRSRG